MPNTPLAVFDLDGTLAETSRDLTVALNVSLAHIQLPPMDEPSVRALVGGGARLLIERGLKVNRHEASEDLIAKLVKVFLDYYAQHLADHSHLFKEIPETLDILQQQGWRLAVCTNKPEAMAHQLLQKLGIDHRFAAMTGGDTFPFRKPDARHLLETVRRAGSMPSRSVMIGDSKTDLDVAINANIAAVIVPWGYRGDDDLSAHMLKENISAKGLAAAIMKSLP